MDYGQIDGHIDAHGAATVIARCAPYVTEARRSRIERVLHGRLGSIRVLSERPEDPHNAAAIVRTAEAFGVLHVHVVAASTGALHAPSTTQGAYHWVHTHHHDSLAELLVLRRKRPFLLAGAAMHGALPVDRLPVDRPLCVAFGNEGEGLSASLLEACDLTFRIPMVGMSESLNLSVSAAITLFTVTSARRAFLGTGSDLVGAEYLREKARYYAKSVEPRLLEGVFAR
jgi:tRNA (guanosine-2'-O-)-methyltransferase